ncbi:hypothetical protein [Rubrivirga sp. IMCC45206]|uniref:hypothetical protein n=1 Tax=Rubrivirga sp. IMCC45206 TaxID=3391614 RepID=UPI00398FBE0C
MRFSLLVLVLLAVAGCDTTEPDAPLAPALPLAVGAEWTLERAYRVTFDDGVPLDTVALDAGSRRHTLRATRDTVVDGETWVRIEAVTDVPDGPTFFHCVFGDPAWYANREGGLARWTETPADAQIVYAVGVTPGVPFLDDDRFTAALVDDDARALGLPVRTYARTWRRVDLNAEVRGPIAPTGRTVDALSPSRGPIVLESQFVSSEDGGATFVPTSTVGYRRVDL